jgi:hypothetical protein
MGRLRDFSKMLALWAGQISLPGLLLFFNEHLPFAMLFQLLIPALVLGAVGAAIMTFIVQPGEKLGALLVGIVVGFGLPPVAFWGLAAARPRTKQRWAMSLPVAFSVFRAALPE